jgi:hypothetical protein
MSPSYASVFGGLQMNIRRRLLAAAAVSVTLGGCGGGGSGTAPVAVVPAPTPTAAPSPNPSPTASPAPTAFRTVLGGGLVGSIIFDTNADGVFGNTSREGVSDAIAYTNRNGDFGRGVLERINTAGEPPATANAAIQAIAVDPITGFFYSDVRVASGVTVLSPTTSLLRFVDDDVVAANTGIGLTARQLGAFDYSQKLGSPEAAERGVARRMLALDLKLIAYAFIGNGLGAYSDGGIAVRAGVTPVVERLAQAPLDLNDPAQADGVLVRYGDINRATEEQRKAIAQLFARYGQAVDSYLAQGGTSARIQYGLRLGILPEVARVLRGNSVNPSRVAGITVADLIAEFERYVDLQPQNPAPGLFATPDVRTVYRLDLDPLVLSGCASERRSPICNDISVTNVIGQAEGTRIDFASVPAQFANDLSLTLDGNNALVIRRLTTDRKTVWINYTSRSPAGQASSRLYLRLNEEGS